MSKDGGGYAFPRRLPDVLVHPDKMLEFIERYSGMELRDYFAAQAMNGWQQNPTFMHGVNGNIEEIARWAYQLADEMLKARDR